MTIISQVSEALRNVLTTRADELGKESGFIKRQVKVSGSWFAQTLSFGWLMNPRATLEELTQTGASLGVTISPQGLDQRFTAEASKLLRALVDVAVTQGVRAAPTAVELLARFNGVYLADSTIVTLPTVLASTWQGSGGHEAASKAAVKVEVGLDLVRGHLIGPLLEAGRVQDRGSALQQTSLPPGALRVTNLGYWSLDQLEACLKRQVFWLLRINPQVHFTDASGHHWDILDFAKTQRGDEVNLPLTLGAKKALSARLLGQRVPAAVAAQRRRKIRAAAKRNRQPPSPRRLALAAWSFFVANLPPERLSLAEAFVIARLRWQIELLFKCGKSHGCLDPFNTQNPWRILCEFYAKLLAMIIQHWALLTCCWAFPDRSLVKAAKTVRQHAFCLLLALLSPAALEQAFTTLQAALRHGCRINKSRKTLRTFQLLLQFGETPA